MVLPRLEKGHLALSMLPYHTPMKNVHPAGAGVSAKSKGAQDIDHSDNIGIRSDQRRSIPVVVRLKFFGAGRTCENPAQLFGAL